MDKKCQRCQAERPVSGNRYCKECRKAVLAELRDAGYFTPAPAFVGQWSGVGRSSGSRELTRETRRGVDC